MTREEMIEQFENMILLIRQNGKDWWDERDIPVLEEAIKAMKMEPCEDTISRQAVLDEIETVCFSKAWSKFRADNGSNGTRDYVINYIKQLPSVQPEQRTGHWIMTGDYYTGAYGSIDYVRCSCCHEDSLEEGNYCPNCGAKMEESEDE